MTRIAIVTTIDRRSPIASATLRTAKALAEHADVMVFAEPTEHPLSCPLPLRAIDSPLLSEHEHIIAAVGDSRFHVGTFTAVRHTPAVIILHDVLMAHLVAASMAPRELHHEFLRWYGSDQASVALDAATAQPFWDTERALEAPLFESVTEFASGVVVHSQFAANCVGKRTVAPVRVIPLAYEATRSASSQVLATAEGTVLLTLGQDDANQCHELVIESLVELGDPTARYVVAGGITDRRRAFLNAFAEGLGVGAQVDIVGSVGDEEAGRLLDSATVCLTLRMPAIEGGSASLVEQMAAGKCVVVFDHGCYSETPDECVVKLAPASSPSSIAKELRALIGSPQRRIDVGERAHRHVETTNSVSAYARKLLEFLVDVESAQPLTHLARRLATVTRPWGLPHESPLSDRWAGVVTSMLSVSEPDQR